MTGIRAPLNTTGQQSRARFTANQTAVGQSVWETEVKGVYPSQKADLASGNSFTMCPISEVRSLSFYFLLCCNFHYDSSTSKMSRRIVEYS